MTAVQRNETKAKWEDDGVGKIVRVKYGEGGHVALADAAYVNRLEEVNADLLDALEGVASSGDFGNGDELCWCPERWWDSMPDDESEGHSQTCISARAAIAAARGAS